MDLIFNPRGPPVTNLLWVKINTLVICKPGNMFRQRNPYTSPSSHGLPVMQRSFKLTRNMILMQFTWIRHCHITVITVTAHERHGALKHRPFDGLFNNLFQASIELNASMLCVFLADALARWPQRSMHQPFFVPFFFFSFENEDTKYK